MNKRNIVGVLAIALLLSVPLVTAEPITIKSFIGKPIAVDVTAGVTTFGELKNLYAQHSGKDIANLHMSVVMPDNAVVTKAMTGADYTIKAFMKKHHDGKYMHHNGMRMHHDGTYMNHDGQRMHHNRDGQTCDHCARPRCERCECGCRHHQNHHKNPELMGHESMRNHEEMPS